MTHPSLSDPIIWADARREAMRILLFKANVVDHAELNKIWFNLTTHLYMLLAK